ncbi:hypothetical protein MPSEU_000745500 [Mayamaea pseudoterrestris]|nr:hypothetical protein MPSEU_000745500 [Mayamaea pseudoterrestris]
MTTTDKADAITTLENGEVKESKLINGVGSSVNKDHTSANSNFSSKILCRTIQELTTRHEIETCLANMTADLELSTRLHDELVHESLVNDLLSKLAQAQAALDEVEAVRRQQRDRDVKMADSLLQEMLAWSQEHGLLKRVEQDYKNLLQQHDEVVARLLQKEMELEDFSKRVKQNRNASSANATENDKQEAEACETAQNIVGDDLLQQQETVALAISDSLNDTLLQSTNPPAPLQMPLLESTKTDGSDLKDEMILEPKLKDFVPSPPQSPSRLVQATEPTVSLIAENAESDTLQQQEQQQQDQGNVSLDELDNKYLMLICSYLDALDILNLAQTNIGMYSRIDTMFGMGGDDNDSTIASDEQQMQYSNMNTSAEASSDNIGDRTGATTESVANSTNASTALATLQEPPAAAPQQPQATIVNIPPAPATASIPVSTPTRATTKSDPNGSSSKMNVYSTPTRERSNSSAAATTPAPIQTAGSFDGPRNIFASLLQPRKSPIASSSQSNNNNSNKSSIMSAAMANSMGAKLSDAELNAIITMTKRLKEKESLVESLQQHVSETTAKLEGSEAVKQFLVQKCREMEDSLAALQDHDSKVALQIATDQDVIAYLDGRVQELEGKMEELQAQLDQSVATVQRVQEQAEQKSIVMGDMLQYEREKLQESEREWKATKKLLIKEVKHCRAQMVSLQAERDGYREQNDKLKSAVLSSSSVSSPSSAVQRNYSQSLSSSGY